MAAAEHAAGSGPTAGEYIIHHLTHLQNHKQTAIVDFSVFNLDSIFFAVLMGLVLVKLMLVDRRYMGDLAGIVSFLAVGGLLVLVGRIAPTPPRRGAEEPA